MVKSKENLVGAYAFLAGVILAVVLGFMNKSFESGFREIAYTVLIGIGIFVGILNVGDKNALTFLAASVSVALVAGAGQSALLVISGLDIISTLTSVLSSLLTLFIPATIIVAVKTVFSISKV